MIDLHKIAKSGVTTCFMLLITSFFILITAQGLGLSPANAAPVEKKLSVTLLGDSFSSGNGAGSYYAEQAHYQSRRSWAHEYTNWLSSQNVTTTFTNLARSGNRTDELLKIDVNKIGKNTDLAMFTIGGNDANFADVVLKCFADTFRNAFECRDKVAAANAAIPTIINNTRQIFQKLDEQMDASGQIVLVGYPLLAQDVGYRLRSCNDLFLTDCLEYDAVREIRNTGKKFESAQAKLVTEWNLTNDRKILYVSGVSDAFSGNEPNPHTDTRNPHRWLNEFFETEGIDYPGGVQSTWSIDMANWYHPNITGHQKVADLLKRQLGVPTSAKTITPKNGDIDVAFVVDTTGSMGSYLSAMKANIAAIVAGIQSESSSARFALISYKDHPSSGGDSTDFPAKLHAPFSADISLLTSELMTLYALGGGDWEESVHSGVMEAMRLDWRPGVRKVTIVLGDAPAKDPEPVTNYTWQQSAQIAYDLDPVEIYGIDTNALALGSFQQLSDRSGGKIFRASSSGNVTNLIVEATRTSLNKPFGWIQGPYIGKVGDTLTLDGRGSYATSGHLVKYEWDLDGNGTYETPSSGPQLTHRFTSEFGGTIGLRVTDSNGQTGIGSTRLDITNDGDNTPREQDNCPDVYNYSQSDYDGDGIGDECDPTPGVFQGDETNTFEVGEDDIARRYEVDMTDPRNPQRRVVEMYRIDENGVMQPLNPADEATYDEPKEDIDTLLEELKAERAAEQAKYDSGDSSARWVVFVVGGLVALGAIAGLVFAYLRRRP